MKVSYAKFRGNVATIMELGGEDGIRNPCRLIKILGFTFFG